MIKLPADCNSQHACTSVHLPAFYPPSIHSTLLTYVSKARLSDEEQWATLFHAPSPWFVVATLFQNCLQTMLAQIQCAAGDSTNAESWTCSTSGVSYVLTCTACIVATASASGKSSGMSVGQIETVCIVVGCESASLSRHMPSPLLSAHVQHCCMLSMQAEVLFLPTHLSVTFELSISCAFASCLQSMLQVSLLLVSQ